MAVLRSVVDRKSTVPNLSHFVDLLVDMADYVFISKDYARFKGFSTKEETVEGFATRCRPGYVPSRAV